MEYELVHEIKNLCPNNQMRDIFFDEVDTDDPIAYVRSRVKGELIDLRCDREPGGTVTVHACVDGLFQTFTFTPL